MLIRDRLCMIVAEKYGVLPDSLSGETRFMDIGESMDFVEIILESEEIFGIRIDTEIALKLEDIQSLADHVETTLGKATI